MADSLQRLPPGSKEESKSTDGTTVTDADLERGICNLGLDGQAVCVHSSLRSLGRVQGGAREVISAFLRLGCTLVVPTFSYGYSVPPPPDMRPARNGWQYDVFPGSRAGVGQVYSPDSVEIDREDMGAIPAAAVNWPGHVRGNHPLDSFAAVGPLAEQLIAGQRPLDVYAPLEALALAQGWVLMVGVDLGKMTLLHLAEARAGRTLFRRWANGPDGAPMMVEVGGCSDGFPQLAPVLAPLARGTQVGTSQWRAYPINETLDAASRAISHEPQITHCGDPECDRCNDAVLGGPILTP